MILRLLRYGGAALLLLLVALVVLPRVRGSARTHPETEDALPVRWSTQDPNRFSRPGLADYSRFIKSATDCSSGTAGAEAVKALADYYRTERRVSPGSEDVMALERSRCEQAIRQAWNFTPGPIELTSDSALADCVVFRLARSCDPEDIVLLLRLGSEAPAAWSYRILHQALLVPISSHRDEGLSAQGWSRIAGELVRALRLSQEKQREAEMRQPMDQFLGRYGRAPVKREIGGGIRLVLEAMNAMQVVATPELCAMAERELAQAESPKAKAALQQLLQSLERKPARRVQDGKTSASLPGR